MQPIRRAVRRPDSFLALLLATDTLFIIGHVIFMVMHLVVWNTPGLLDYIPSPYSIVKERSFAEVFQYLKAYWLVIMFLWLVVRLKEPGYLAWAVMFLYLGLDDLLQIHEERGNDLAIRYSLPEVLGQRSRDLGELLVFAIVGTVLLTLLGIAYLTGSQRFREHTRNLIPLVAILAFAGIVVDALHIIFLYRSAGAIFGLIEDGGEMIALSLIVWYVWLLVTESDSAAGQGDKAPERPGRHTRRSAKTARSTRQR